jgi:hypothetical protein
MCLHGCGQKMSAQTVLALSDPDRKALILGAQKTTGFPRTLTFP